MGQVNVDPRFKYFTGCQVIGLYKKVPQTSGGVLLQVKYKEEYKCIEINHSFFFNDIINLIDGKSERLSYVEGCRYINLYKEKEKFVVFITPSSESFEFYYFSEKEFNKIKESINEQIICHEEKW